MFRPNGEGLKQAIQQSLDSAQEPELSTIDYINPHGSGTKVGDEVEAGVIREIFGGGPLVSSTKSLTGHSMAAAGALEVIYTLLMLDHNFVAATANLDHIAPECEGIRHVRSAQEIYLRNVMSFNFGLGGTNASLLFRKL
jgi:3-oxoacyl-[acyl-carrier-protein] synthase-1